jgi:hypothetical protein
MSNIALNREDQEGREVTRSTSSPLVFDDASRQVL